MFFIGLPQSDVYMMGRDHTYAEKPRGTLHIPSLIRKHGFQCAMAVNNVGNAFTPQGWVDPLSLCPFGAAIYQAATSADCRILLVSFRHRDFSVNYIMWHIGICLDRRASCYRHGQGIITDRWGTKSWFAYFARRRSGIDRKCCSPTTAWPNNHKAGRDCSSTIYRRHHSPEVNQLLWDISTLVKRIRV